METSLTLVLVVALVVIGLYGVHGGGRGRGIQPPMGFCSYKVTKVNSGVACAEGATCQADGASAFSRTNGCGSVDAYICDSYQAGSIPSGFCNGDTLCDGIKECQDGADDPFVTLNVVNSDQQTEGQTFYFCQKPDNGGTDDADGDEEMECERDVRGGRRGKGGRSRGGKGGRSRGGDGGLGGSGGGQGGGNDGQGGGDGGQEGGDGGQEGGGGGQESGNGEQDRRGSKGRRTGKKAR